VNHLEKLYAARIEQMQTSLLRAELEEAMEVQTPSARAAANLIEVELHKREKKDLFL
jgi:hypothetical protein